MLTHFPFLIIVHFLIHSKADAMFLVSLIQYFNAGHDTLTHCATIQLITNPA